MLAATFRHPSILAKEAITLDHLTGGRYVLGLGAGWHVGEHEAFGIDLPPVGERFDRFEATVRVLRALFSDEARAGAGRDAGRAAVPARSARRWSPARPARRAADLARRPGTARPADGGALRRRLELRLEPRRRRPTGSSERRDALLRACEAIGRDPAELTLSAQIVIPDDPAPADGRHRAGERLRPRGRDRDHAHDPGPRGCRGIRRLATEVAAPLRDAFG